MKRADLENLIARLGIAPNKQLGQNFLTDENFLDYIAREAAIQPADHIIEVGPGLGALTTRLVASGAPVTAIEFDRKLAAWIRNTLAPKGLRLIEGDACKVDFPSIYGADTEFRLISNLPYSAGTVIVADMLDLDRPPLDMLILLQKEVAFRFAAEPGTDDYGALSVRIQNCYTVDILKKAVPGSLFFPKPEVESALIHLKRKEPVQNGEFRRYFSRFVKAAFAHRRKKMFKQLTQIVSAEALQAAMGKAGVDPETRAERVTPAQFLSMAQELYTAK